MKINVSRTFKIRTVYILHRCVCTALGCRRIIFGATLYGTKGDWDFRISDLVKNPEGTDI